MMESGRQVKIIFDGAGTQAAAALSAPITSIITCSNNDTENRLPLALLLSAVERVCDYVRPDSPWSA